MKHARTNSSIPADAAHSHRLIEVKHGVASARAVREGLMHLAYATGARPRARGILVLTDVAVTQDRLEKEWRQFASLLRPEIAGRLSLCFSREGSISGIPREPDARTRQAIAEAIAREGSRIGPHPVKGSASFVVIKVLLYQWLSGGKPVTAEWLARTSGFSYPTVAGVLRDLGSLVEKRRDRRIRLRWFPKERFARLLANSDRARATARFIDTSGQPRSIESYVQRLVRLGLPNIAVGGVLGARHYVPKLDLVGTPRLDVSVHCPNRSMDLSFIGKLDPALKRVSDPLEPASVVVHAVRHADPLFVPKSGGLFWADPVECLLDLHEAQLEKQAAQFLATLERERTAAS